MALVAGVLAVLCVVCGIFCGGNAELSKITKSAKGEQCQIRLPGICNHNPETTVFCHINGGGMGMKHNDIHGAYGCSDCHSVVDGPRKVDFSSDLIKLWFLEAMLRTQLILIEKGLIET